MRFADWLIVVLPLLSIIGAAIYSGKYTRSVVDFLAAGRVAGRYVISVGDLTAALSVITPEYSTGDKVIAWSYLIYSLGYSFILNFIAVIIWNLISPWPISWWGYYSLITFVIVPAAMAAFTAVWFSIGGAFDLRNMFRDLEHRVSNPLDDGRVEGNMSLADKASLEAVDRKSTSDTQEIRGKTVDLCKK